jgi:glycosyltransferase involved in cell wall biosynthesis
MQSFNLINNNYLVINNVVDDFFFEVKPVVHRTKKRILHVSCFDEQAKNVKGIIRATHELSKIREDFELILIGTGLDFDEVYAYYQTFTFPKGMIHFLGEKKPEEVCNWLQNSDFFVLFSNYENAPVVISESLACGKPVLSSNVGGIAEQINETNGILINAKDEVALKNKMDFLLNNFSNYDKEAIRNAAINQFSYKAVGEKIYNEYKRILK